MRLPVVFIGCALICCSDSSSPNPTTQPNASLNSTPIQWQQVWDDEFNYTGLPDSTKWNYDVGGNGWGNNELEYYTKKRKENARVENGNLVIEVKKEQTEKNAYSSARLVTKGKGDWFVWKNMTEGCNA